MLAGRPVRAWSSCTLAIALLALLLGACGGGRGDRGTTAPNAATAGTSPAATTPTAAVVRVRVRVPGRRPVAGRPFPITVLASENGRPATGRISYGFVVAGQVVARRSNYRFRGGRFRDTLRFPTRAVGVPLTLRVFVTTRRGRGQADVPVRVRPGP